MAVGVGMGGASTVAVQGYGYSKYTPSAQLCLDLRPPPLPINAMEAGELIGYRVWCVSGFGLYSVSMGTQWPPGKVITDRMKAEQEIDDTNQVGVWAFSTKEYLEESFSSPDLVYGTVWLWGTVIEHEKGYRAQYAAIRSLDRFEEEVLENGFFFRRKRMRVLDELRKRYGVGSEQDVDKSFPLIE